MALTKQDFLVIPASFILIHGMHKRHDKGKRICKKIFMHIKESIAKQRQVISTEEYLADVYMSSSIIDNASKKMRLRHVDLSKNLHVCPIVYLRFLNTKIKDFYKKANLSEKLVTERENVIGNQHRTLETVMFVNRLISESIDVSD